MPSLSVGALVCAIFSRFLSYPNVEFYLFHFCCSQLSQMEGVGQDNFPSFEPQDFSLLLFWQGVLICGLGLSEMYRLCFPPLLLSGSSLSLSCSAWSVPPAILLNEGLCPGGELSLVRCEFIGLQTVIMAGCHVSPLVSLPCGTWCFLPAPSQCGTSLRYGDYSSGQWRCPLRWSPPLPGSSVSWRMSKLAHLNSEHVPQLHPGLAELGRCARSLWFRTIVVFLFYLR